MDTEVKKENLFDWKERNMLVVILEAIEIMCNAPDTARRLTKEQRAPWTGFSIPDQLRLRDMLRKAREMQ